MDLRTATQEAQDLSLLTVRGEIDLVNAPVLLEVLQAVLEREAGAVVVDLCEVPFMDSTGVHALVDTQRMLERHNRRFAIACRDGGQVHRLLALVRLLDSLTVHRSRESALIGGDDVIRPQPRHHSWPPTARAPTQNATAHQRRKRSDARAW